jgi:hypothetical protein
VNYIIVTQLNRGLRSLLKRTGKVDLPIGIISEVDERGILCCPILAIGGMPTPTTEGQPALICVATGDKVNAVKKTVPNNITDSSDILWRN